MIATVKRLFHTAKIALNFGEGQILQIKRTDPDLAAKIPPLPVNASVEQASAWANGVTRVRKVRSDPVLAQAAVAAFTGEQPTRSATLPPAALAATPPAALPPAPKTPAASAKPDFSKLTGMAKVITIEKFEAAQMQARQAAPLPTPRAPSAHTAPALPTAPAGNLRAMAEAMFGKSNVSEWYRDGQAAGDMKAERHIFFGGLSAMVPGFEGRAAALSAKFGPPKPLSGMALYHHTEQVERLQKFLHA